MKIPADSTYIYAKGVCPLLASPAIFIFCGTTYYYLSYVILLFTGADTQLYFTLKGNRYKPGDSILITDIRVHEGNTGPGDSLVCNTTDVNTQCCNDTGGGQWYFPNGSIVLRNIDTGPEFPIIRTGRTNQVRLNFRRRQTSPTGEYTCVVPVTDGSVNQTAGIRLVAGT